MKQIEVIIEKVEDVDFVVYPAEMGPRGIVRGGQMPLPNQRQ